MKNPKTLLIVSIILIVLALILFAGASFWGVIFLAVGVFLLLRSLKASKAVKTAPVSSEASVTQSTESDKEDGENIKVAGVSFRQDTLRSFGTINPEYSLTEKQIIDNGLKDRIIYEYEFPQLPAVFQFEPENEYDPNAIAIYVEGKQIGYVKKGSTSHIRKLIESGRIEEAICTIGGGKSKAYWEDADYVETEEREFSAKVHLKLKD